MEQKVGISLCTGGWAKRIIGSRICHVERGVATAWLTDLTGRREEVRLTATGNGQYTLDLTSRSQATYLLTLTTADGHQHTVRLLKQSDIFGQ